MSVSLIYIRQSTPLTILKLPEPVSESSFATGFVTLPSTIDGRVLTPRGANYVIKVIGLYCDTIAMGDISYRYKII